MITCSIMDIFNFILTWLNLFLLLLQRSKKHDERSISGIGKKCINTSVQSGRKCFYLKAFSHQTAH